MFEFSLAFKYLIPRKKQLSVSLISLMSIGVISLVVWLVLVFLSVTEGIEKNWMGKLTKLNAPLRITPTQAYYSSYYYQIDSLCSASHFRPKNIAQKAVSPMSDPYSPEEDGQLPSHFPVPSKIDPVKGVYGILSEMQKKRGDLVFQDYEVSGALMRLQMVRKERHTGKPSQNFLSQVSYVASFPDRSPFTASLVLPPRVQDLNHLFFLSSYTWENTREDAPSLISADAREKGGKRLLELGQYALIQQVKTAGNLWRMPLELLPQNGSLHAEGYVREGHLTHVIVPVAVGGKRKHGMGTLVREAGGLVFQTKEGAVYPVSPQVPLIVEGPLVFDAHQSEIGLSMLSVLSVKGTLQGHPIQGTIPYPWDGLEIAKAQMQTHFSASPPPSLPWLAHSPGLSVLPINEKKETGVLLAKGFQENGVLIGDPGYLAYTTATAGAIQEQRLPIFVAGFYDPGVLAIGNKCVLVPPRVAHTINAASSSFNLDKTESNGIMVWFEDLDSASAVKEEIQAALVSGGMDPYWKVTTFREYDFAKDLLEQFQSDKNLFTLIGIIILGVACCNIISLLILLVNDKKHEIGVLQAMGASPKSIALIFATCGITMGIVSSVIGTAAALFTLHHIDAIVSLLSMLQGHHAFNAAFYGASLPNQLSHNAAIFVLILTPIISLLAGLVPAIKACRLRPSVILRSE